MSIRTPKAPLSNPISGTRFAAGAALQTVTAIVSAAESRIRACFIDTSRDPDA
jgi:hypothetical protein